MGIYDNERAAKIMNISKSRNQERVLSDAMITDIKAELYSDLAWNIERTAWVDNILHCYLTDDWDLFKKFTIELVEHYEDDILLTLNMEIREDLENQNENHA